MKNTSIYLLSLFAWLSAGLKQPIQEPIYENLIQRPFSHPELEDELSISIIGQSIVDGTAIFTINTHDGRRIHHEEFPARFLVGYGLIGEEATVENMEKYIKKHVDEFFVDDQFSNPAIAADEERDEDYSDPEAWKDIKSDQTAIGFYYRVGEEGGCQIAYSKKQRKTLNYFCCC
ncbi:MAG: hypothetical protein R8G66_31230 [Cytophagales bacterium]|nr:hypothetical protein [Cytophagales bacterium]